MKNKIVNVHGVKFDISSILNDVTASIQNNIQKSLDCALKDYELYKSTHDAILQIPFVRELYIQNQQLISQLEMLEQPLQSQSIQLKIDELSPPSSPLVMHSYFQIDPNDDNPFANNENKKLSSASEQDTASEAEEDEEEEVSASEAEEDEEEEVSASASEAEAEEAEEEEEEAVSASASEAEEAVSASEAEAEAEEEEEEEEEEEAVSASEAEAEAEAKEEEVVSESEEEEEEEEAVSAEEEAEEEEEAVSAEEEAEEEEEAISASASEVEEEAVSASASEVEEEAEEEVYEIVIKNVTYFTTNENDGDIYSCVDGDVGEIVGKFKNKKPVFMKRK